MARSGAGAATARLTHYADLVCVHLALSTRPDGRQRTDDRNAHAGQRLLDLPTAIIGFLSYNPHSPGFRMLLGSNSFFKLSIRPLYSGDQAAAFT